MRLTTTTKVGFVFLVSVLGSQAADLAGAPAIPPDYRIGPGDVISVNVYKEPEASLPQGALVRSDGKVSLPLLDDVRVEGMTTAEVKKELTKRLLPLIPGADVTVRVAESHSKKVYLDGGVKKVGPIDLAGPMTIMQALNTAGGFTDFAKTNKIFIIRTENGIRKQIPFDYDEVVKRGQLNKDIPLQAGDYIVVPK